MTRLSHIVRTDDKGGPGQARVLGGAPIILCQRFSVETTDNNVIKLGLIPITANEDYLRLFLAIYVAGASSDGDPVQVGIGHTGAGASYSAPGLQIPDGGHGTLTSVVDLYVGDHQVGGQLYVPGGATGSIFGQVQIIVGQAVAQTGCGAVES